MKFHRHLGLAQCLLAVSLPAFAQYYSNDITPPSANSGKLNGATKGKQVGGGNNSHAYLLTGNALSAIDLHPATGYYSSMATSTDGFEQCGYSGSSLGGIHAMKWSGSSSSAVDLHPSGFNFSYCTGVDNGQQAGFGEQQSYFVTISHAYLWNGSSTGTDLHPPTCTYSRAMAIRGGEQVGYCSTLAYPYGDNLGYHSTSKAMRWSGSAASALSLHPLGWDASEALATNGVQQGGWGYRLIDSRQHAMLWSGTPESSIDLHPAGYTDSKITAMSATKQAGEGWIGVPGAAGSVRHALLWTGSAASVVDLNQYLPAGYTHAVATGIDADGNVVGYAYNTLTQGIGVPAGAIAVVFAPGQPASASVSSITLSSANVAPGTAVQATVNLAAPAPAGGVTLTFLSTNAALLATPASVVIPEGQALATLSLPVLGTTLTTPASLKLYVSDGIVSKVATLTVTPVVRLSTININAVEGGFAATGTITLSIPAQIGGAVVALTSGNPALLTVPASVTIPQGYTAVSFTAPSTVVTAITSVPVTASFNGTTVTANASVNPAPVITVSSITATSVVGGQTLTGTVLLNNFVRDAAGATINLSTGDTSTVQLPATILIPRNSAVGTFSATTSVVPGTKGVSLKATYNGSQASTTVTISPLPTVTILSAVYKPDTQMLKVDATTSYANSTLTYGSNGVAFGTMQVEAALYQGSIVLASAPATVTVWNSLGGEATIPVTISISGGGSGGGGSVGGGGGGGGGSTTGGTFKLTVNRNGKGSVTSSPAGIACGTASGGCAVSFASGTALTLTATPDPGSPWLGWGGACSGTARTCTVTMSSDKSVTANFR